MGNERHWPRLCGPRRAERARLEECEPFDDPAGVLAEVLLEVLFQMKAINQHIGALVIDSISTQTQSAEQKQRRHTDNVRMIQNNIDGQLRDLNVGLQTIQNDHPTLALGALFLTVHQLDSNFRSLLDTAKEAAGVDADEVPPPPKLIDTSSSMTKEGSAFAGEAPRQIEPDETAQPFAKPGPEPQREPNTQGPQKLTV